MEIACIIEGTGEEDALPVLVRRIIGEIDPGLYVRIHRPIRRPKGTLKKRDELARVVDFAVRAFVATGALLVVLDADDDCPAQLGPQLFAWAQAARSDVATAVVVANREYEAWFLAAAESLAGHRELRDDLSAPADCEAIRDAKGWLKGRGTTGSRYNPTKHQASFSQRMSLELARQRSGSFDKLCRDVQRLVEAIRPPEA